MKISTKITLAIFWGTIITVLSVVFVVYTSARGNLEEMMRYQQLELSRHTVNEVSYFLSQRMIDIKIFSGLDKIVRVTELQRSGGQVNQQDTYLAREELVKIANFSGEWKSVRIVDPAGRVIISTNTEKTPGNIDIKKDHYKDAFDKALKGEPSYTEVFFSDEINDNTMAFLSPVKNSGGAVIGVAVGLVDWEAILAILSLVREYSVLLYDSSGNLIGTNTIEQMPNILKVNNVDHPAIQKASGGETDAGIFPSLNGRYSSLVSYSRQSKVENFEGSNWIILMDVPTNIAFAPASKTAGTILAITLPTVTVTFLIVLLLISRLLFRPMGKLVKVVKAISEGDLNQKVDIDSEDEMGILASSFNDMTAQLTETWRTLEKKVTERTAILATTLQDVEQRNLALQEAKLKNEALLESIGDGVMATDENGKLLVINKAAQESLGWTAMEIVGKTVLNSITLEDKDQKPVPPQERPLHKALKFGVKVSNVGLGSETMYYVRKNKTKFPVFLTASPVILNKKIIGTIIVFRDITKEKEIDMMKTEFISLASHQLRTPLSTVNWYAEILLEGDAGALNEDQKKYMDEIYTANHKMVDLVNALLNVSRIEMGTFLIEPKDTFLPEIAAAVLAEVKPQITTKNLNVIEKYEKNVPVIQADPRIMTIIFQNLVTNAVKYTPDNGTITIELSENKSEQMIDIKVTDTGYGIPKHQQERVFTKLFRADNVRAKETEGTGLGLYIIKAVLEYSGGKISFVSEEDKGTTFFVSIPIAGMKKKEGSKTLG